jgi:hypothetical protein
VYRWVGSAHEVENRGHRTNELGSPGSLFGLPHC